MLASYTAKSIILRRSIITGTAISFFFNLGWIDFIQDVSLSALASLW